ncbi:MAG TPA: hypothetical protein VHP58_05700 [Alphaproteobacteria bacterium]|nr:hypothetical protein [Alphaproteobacteria bacterium]
MATIKQKASKLADRGLDKADDVIDRARDGKQRLERRYDNADIGGRIEEFAEETGRNLRYAYDTSADKLEETADNTRDLVQRNPLIAIAGAFVGGMLASALLRR